MVVLTERAKRELKTILSWVAPVSPEIGLRITSAERGRFKVVPDTEKEDDQVIKHEGCKVLLICRELAELLEGATLDYQSGDEGECLIVWS